MSFRIGLGYDVHPLLQGRSLVLGGVAIPGERGLDGHSDADSLTHAVIDALLGAAALGDIGRQFPDTDPAHLGVDSQRLLVATAATLAAAGWTLVNLDAVVIAQQPRLAPHLPAMVQALAQSLGCAPERISIKATSPESLGALGRSEGIAAQAVALIESSAFNSPPDSDVMPA